MLKTVDGTESVESEFEFNPFESYDQNLISNLQFLSIRIDTEDDQLKDLIGDLRKLWVTRVQRSQTVKETVPVSVTDTRYELVMYNTFTVSESHFKNEMGDYDSEPQEITYWEPRPVQSGYKWKHIMGSRKTNIKEHESEKKKSGRPKKETHEKKYIPKTNKKGRPKNSKNKSEIKKSMEQEMNELSISDKKYNKMLTKGFKLKPFRNKEYKIKKIDWKKRCNVIREHIDKKKKDL